MGTDRFIRIALPTATVFAFLIAWTVYVHTAEVSAFILPTPMQIVSAFIGLVSDPDIWGHALVTVIEAVSGFMIAVVLGISLGMAMARVQMLEWAFKPFIVCLQLIPKIALAPLFILWFGFGLESKIVIAAALAFFRFSRTRWLRSARSSPVIGTSSPCCRQIRFSVSPCSTCPPPCQSSWLAWKWPW